MLLRQQLSWIDPFQNEDARARCHWKHSAYAYCEVRRQSWHTAASVAFLMFIFRQHVNDRQGLNVHRRVPDIKLRFFAMR